MLGEQLLRELLSRTGPLMLVVWLLTEKMDAAIQAQTAAIAQLSEQIHVLVQLGGH